MGSDIKNGEIMVLSFDGVNQTALEYVIDDKISCIAECNPLHGPRVETIIEMLESGKVPEKFSYVDEEIYAHNDTVKEVIIDEKVYSVKKVSVNMIKE